jgi:hypothetical protein
MGIDMTLSICNYKKMYIYMYCSGSGFPGEQFRLLGASSFRTPLEPPIEKFLNPPIQDRKYHKNENK